MTLEYDSADSTKQVEGAFSSIAALLHQPNTILINNKGAVISDTDTTNPASLSNNITAANMLGITQQLFDIYPNATVKPGDTWNKTTSANMSFLTITAESSYKLISVINSVAHIEVNTTLKSVTGGSEQVEKMNINMKGIQTGTIDMDVNTGLIIKAQLNSRMNGEMNIMDVNAPTNISSDIHIKGFAVK